MEERGDAHGGGAADPSAAAPLDRAGSGPEAIVWRELSVGAALEDGRFVVQRQIGHGGAGMVYEAIDRERDGARVAIKTLRLADPEALYHLKNEFRSLGDVAHPNLVRLRELSNDAGCWFVAMDLVRGVDFCAYARGPAGADRESITDAIDIDGDPTLLEGDDARQGAAPGAVRRRGSAAFDEARLRAATAQLAGGVAAIHAAGMLHRDLKPSNVLVGDDGHVTILDFGLVSEQASGGIGQTVLNRISGTPAYMAPEQCAGAAATVASDWYAVGVMLYVVLTGRPPFEGDVGAVLAAKQHFDGPPRQALDAAPPDLADLCLALLRRDPAERAGAEDVRRVLGAGGEEARAPAAPARIPLFGRERELASLDDALARTGRGETVVVAVHGDSGVGKSTLVRHFLDEARSRGAVVLSSRCYERESVPYKAFDSLVDDLGRHLTQLAPVEAAALLPRDIGALARLFPSLRRVDAVANAPGRAFETPDAQELRERAFAALRELLARLRDRGPVVVHSDDTQWGDTDSAALLLRLVRHAEAPRVLFVLSHRGDDVEASPMLSHLRDESFYVDVDIALEPLDAEAAQSLAMHLLCDAGAGASELARAAAADAGGNPFFVLELARHARSGAALGGQVTLQQLLGDRVGGLEAPARGLLQAVAVAGQPIAQAIVIRAAGLGPAGREILDHLRDQHWVRTDTSGAHARVECFHDRVRETVVALLDAATVRACHHALAEGLEAHGGADPEILAAHLEAAGETARAATHAAQAGERALEALAFERAAALFRKSLELGELPVGEAQRLRVHLAEALANGGRGEAAAEEYLNAARVARPVEALELERRAAEQLLVSGHVERGMSVVRQVLSKLDMRLSQTFTGAVTSLLVRRVRLWLRGIDFRERAEDSIDEREVARIDASWTISMGLAMTDNVRGADFQTRHLMLALNAGEPYRIARALAMEVAFVGRLGIRHRPRTMKLLHGGLALCERLDNPHALGLTQMVAGLANACHGEWRPAFTYTEASLRTLADRCTGVAWETSTAHFVHNWTAFCLGEAAALRQVPALFDDAQRRGNLYDATMCIAGFGQAAWLVNDDVDGAARAVDGARRLWSTADYQLPDFLLLLSECYLGFYRGDFHGPWHRVRDDWQPIKRAHLRLIEVLEVFARHVRGLAAVRAASGPAPGDDRERLLATAARDARWLGRSRFPGARPFGALVDAGLAGLAGDVAVATRALGAAAVDFDASAMPLHAAAARYRRACVEGGAADPRLLDTALAPMAVRGIRNPRAMADMLAPGTAAGPR